jgi:hypothetical protein
MAKLSGFFLLKKITLNNIISTIKWFVANKVHYASDIFISYLKCKYIYFMYETHIITNV